jgi:hypothetical protein
VSGTGTFCKIPTIEESCALIERATKEAKNIDEWLSIVDAGDPWLAANRKDYTADFERFYDGPADPDPMTAGAIE